MRIPRIGIMATMGAIAATGLGWMAARRTLAEESVRRSPVEFHRERKDNPLRSDAGPKSDPGTRPSEPQATRERSGASEQPPSRPEELAAWILRFPDADFAGLIGTARLHGWVSDAIGGFVRKEVDCSAPSPELREFLERLNEKIRSCRTRQG